MIANNCIDLIQGSDEWKLARLGFVSASNIADVMAIGRSGEAIGRKKYKTKLVAERLTMQPLESFTNDAMAWGVQTEPMARIAFETFTNQFVDQTGFWKHSDIEWLGCSPDGLLGQDKLIEIKCPNTTTHLDYIFANEVPGDYYKQIQCQLWVTGRQSCFFVSYDPRLPERNQLFIKEILKDEKLISEMTIEVKAFLSEVEQLMARLTSQ